MTYLREQNFYYFQIFFVFNSLTPPKNICFLHGILYGICTHMYIHGVNFYFVEKRVLQRKTSLKNAEALRNRLYICIHIIYIKYIYILIIFKPLFSNSGGESDLELRDRKPLTKSAKHLTLSWLAYFCLL